MRNKLLFILLLFCGSTYAQSTQEVMLLNASLIKKCQQFSPIVSVSSNTSKEVDLDRTLSVKEITLKTSKKIPVYVKSHSVSWGFTVATYGFDTDYQINTLESPETTCAIPGIKIILFFNEMNMKIARELSKGSCAYNYVLAHESEHVNIYKRGLNLMAQSLKEKLQEKFKNKRFISNNKYTAIKDSKEYINSFYDDLITQGIKEISDAHNRFDSEDEYVRAALACNGELYNLSSN